MQFILVLLTLAVSAFSQSVSISAPTVGQSLFVGQSLMVRVDKPRTLSPSTDVGIAIAIAHCNQDPCEDHSQQLGTVLYTGSYSPQDGPGDYYPFQNISVVLPPQFPNGQAVISVAHAALVGAMPYLSTDVANVTVNMRM
ncbi:hypothetical protein BD410DRAFT_808269 [Rickenella mellea]|uniref:Uncharacterized protein n=1 Tax=Rickenella mellea TaxID=50990 RepID=A0A4Y7PLE8_9AGAM|nr:hypothetical protein BD410DRAFT_808269 [Rickenella mellea]